jgi:hypothetical protein
MKCDPAGNAIIYPYFSQPGAQSPNGFIKDTLWSDTPLSHSSYHRRVFGLHYPQHLGLRCKMTEKSWAGQVIDEFFAVRKSPTRSQCDRLALSISEASEVHPVDVPGSLSYTVVCTRTQSQDQHQKESIILSFRQSPSRLDEEIVGLAQVIHGCLVPHGRNHGIMSGSDPPLSIYTMPLLPGVACLETLSYQADMSPDEEAKHICFVMHLARYNHHFSLPFLTVIGQSAPI